MRASSLVAVISWMIALASVAASADAGMYGDAAIASGGVLDTARSRGARRTPEQPKLQQRSDGTYEYSGQGFNATIERDGTVRMRDQFGRFRLGPRARPLNEQVWTVNFFEVGFDFFAWLERKFGNDPYRSERRWFLEGTRDLRERLATQAAAESVRRALYAIWSRAGLSLEQRRAEAFAMWDATSDDEVGQIGRAEILLFVRERCPPDTPSGYTRMELETLNRRRRSRHAFAPYAAQEDAGAPARPRPPAVAVPELSAPDVDGR